MGLLIVEYLNVKSYWMNRHLFIPFIFLHVTNVLIWTPCHGTSTVHKGIFADMNRTTVNLCSISCPHRPEVTKLELNCENRMCEFTSGKKFHNTKFNFKCMAIQFQIMLFKFFFKRQLSKLPCSNSEINDSNSVSCGTFFSPYPFDQAQSWAPWSDIHLTAH